MLFRSPYYLDTQTSYFDHVREGSPVMSFEVILPLLRPIAHLIQDPEVSEIMVNGSRRIFVEHHGLVHEVTVSFRVVQELRAREPRHMARPTTCRLRALAFRPISSARSLARRPPSGLAWARPRRPTNRGIPRRVSSTRSCAITRDLSRAGR